jgi:hypothetical protein
MPRDTDIPAVYAISFDERSLAWIDELILRLSAFELVQGTVKLIELVRCILRGAIAFNPKVRPAGGANENRIVLEPCEGLLCLMAALGTFERNGDLVNKARHVASSG